MLNYSVQLTDSGLNVLRVSCRNEQTFELDLYDFYKDKSSLETLYQGLNEYVQQLPIQTQTEIYNIFFFLYTEDYKSAFEDEEVITRITSMVREVTALLDYPRFRTWVRNRADTFSFPDAIGHEFIYDPDMSKTEEKTYLYNEYLDLIAFILFIRLLAPLIVDFFNYHKSITNHIYYRLYTLLTESDLAECDEINKLKSYIHSNYISVVGTARNENMIISSGLSDEDIIANLTAEVIFNKLLAIDFINRKCNIVSFIFQTVKFKGKQTPSGSSAIRSKPSGKSSALEDMSYFEDYRKTSDITVGVIVEIQHSLSNLDVVLRGLGVTNFNYEMYEAELKDMRKYMLAPMDNLQIVLLGWFMSKVINPRALYYIEYLRLYELMLIARVVLYQRGDYYLAMLISARKTSDYNYVSSTIRSTLTKSSALKLSEKYRAVTEEDKPSVIEKAVLEMSRDIYNSSWIAIGNKETLANVQTIEECLVHPTNLNDVILDFVHQCN